MGGVAASRRANVGLATRTVPWLLQPDHLAHAKLALKHSGPAASPEHPAPRGQFDAAHLDTPDSEVVPRLPSVTGPVVNCSRAQIIPKLLLVWSEQADMTTPVPPPKSHDVGTKIDVAALWLPRACNACARDPLDPSTSQAAGSPPPSSDLSWSSRRIALSVFGVAS